MINEAAFCLAEGIVASPAKLDLAMIFGTGFPPFRGGLCAHADALGATAVVDGLQKLAAEKGAALRAGAAPRRHGQHGKEVLRRPHDLANERSRDVDSQRRDRRQARNHRSRVVPEDALPGRHRGGARLPVPGDPRGREGDRGGVRERLHATSTRPTSTPRRSTREHFFPREVVKAMGELGRHRDDDPRGVRRQRLLVGGVLPDDGGDRRRSTLRPRSSSAPTSRSASSRSSSSGATSRRRSGCPTSRPESWSRAFCLTEPEAGSDAGSLKTTAVYDPATDEYVLNGTKQWISNGGFATLLHGLRPDPLGAPRRRTRTRRSSASRSSTNPDGTLPGLSRGAEEKKLGLCASSTCQIIFENCRVPAANLIGEKGPRLQGRPRDAEHGPDVARRGLGRRLEDDAQARGRARDAAQAVQDPRSPTSR